MTKKQKDFKKDWAMVGGRIQDYAYTAVQKSPREASREIERDYTGRMARMVWNGLKIYLRYGVGAYFYGIDAA
jgi:hypothetical protein